LRYGFESSVSNTDGPALIVHCWGKERTESVWTECVWTEYL